MTGVQTCALPISTQEILTNFSGFNEFSTDTLLRDIYVKTTEKEVKKPQKAQEEAVAEQTTEGTQDQSDAVVEAPKKAGRPAKGK